MAVELSVRLNLQHSDGKNVQELTEAQKRQVC